MSKDMTTWGVVAKANDYPSLTAFYLNGFTQLHRLFTANSSPLPPQNLPEQQHGGDGKHNSDAVQHQHRLLVS